jgi:hypothetical protein
MDIWSDMVYTPFLFTSTVLYVARTQVVFAVMSKFQAKYAIRVDRDAMFDIALKDFSRHEGGGRPTLGGDSRGQVILPLKNGAKVVFGREKTQVYWSGDYEDVEKIEEFLNKLVVFGTGETKRFGLSTREDVPTDRLYKKKIAEITSIRAEQEEVLKRKEWKLEVIAALETSVKIRNGKVSDHLTVNRSYYLGKAQAIREKLVMLLEEGIENGWECNDRIRTEIERLGKIVDSKGRL